MTHPTDAELDEIEKGNLNRMQRAYGRADLVAAARDRNRLEREMADLRERCAMEADALSGPFDRDLPILSAERRTAAKIAAAIRALPLTKEA